MVAYLIVFYADSVYSVTTDTIIAAILHDIVEDTDFTINMVELAFGTVVSEIVYGLTRVRGDKKLTVSELLESVIQKEYSILKTEKVNITTAISMFFIQCGWPVCFYIAFIYGGDILKKTFHYSAEEVIHHNFFLGVLDILGMLPLIYLSRYIYPIIILKVKFVIFTIFILFFPYLLQNVQTPLQLFCIQSFIMVFVLEIVPAMSIFIKHFPVLKRFTFTAVLYALSRAFMFIVTGVICIYLTKYLGAYGLFIVIIPLLIGYVFGIHHFEKLDKEAGKCN